MSLRRLSARLEKAKAPSSFAAEPTLDLGLDPAPSEIAPGSDASAPLTVSDLTSTIRDVLESQFGELWVAGEISNFRNPGSGHLYFTLKDATATLSAVMFRGEAMRVRLPLREGQAVLVRGRITVYEARGQYQMQVLELRAQGQGALQQRFEELKRQLQAEGLFDLDRKRPLPDFPETIGIVTSLQGAVLQDIRNVLQRRAPGIKLLVRGVRVQGEGAAAEIAAALRAFAAPSAENRVDLILLARGGGSLEDLWTFNEEIVARALAASPLPTISAIGHETDFTIADFVADLRAPTPSAAAELLTRDWAEWREEISALGRRLDRAARQSLQVFRHDWERLTQSYIFREPRRLIQQWAQRVDDAKENLTHAAQENLATRRRAWQLVELRLKAQAPRRELARRRAELVGMQSRLNQQHPQRKITAFREKLTHLSARLRTLGPQGTLDRGYALVLDDQGVPLRRAEKKREGQTARILLAQGAFSATLNLAEPTATLFSSGSSVAPPSSTAPQKRGRKKK